MKAYWGSGDIAPLILWPRQRGDLSASRPGHFIPRERDPDTPWIGGWLGPRAVLDAVVKRKIPSPRRQSNPRTPIVQPIAQRYTDWAITGQHRKYELISMPRARLEPLTPMFEGSCTALYPSRCSFHPRIRQGCVTTKLRFCGVIM
jgi:hypothetical protein